MELLTPSDVANILGLSAAGVRDAADDGRLRVAASTPKGMRLFTRDDVERFKRDRARAKR
jgi:DNA-binding transcriptional MerR regulator